MARVNTNNMKRIFRLKIIQPNFDKLYKEYEQMFVDNQKQKSEPVAIKIQGKLKGSKIEDNTSIGRLLEADEIEDSSIRGNKVFLSDPKEEKEDILKLSPEFYGVGINLKSLWRKIKDYGKWNDRNEKNTISENTKKRKIKN